MFQCSHSKIAHTPYINSYLWLHCFSRDLERNAKDALNCWAIKCKHAAGRCCLLFSFSKQLSPLCQHQWAWQWLSRHSEPEKTERVHSSQYPELRTDTETCGEFSSYDSTVWLTGSSARRAVTSLITVPNLICAELPRERYWCWAGKHQKKKAA